MPPSGVTSAAPPAPLDYLMVVHVFWPAVVYGGPVYSNLHLCRGLVEQGRRLHVVTTDSNRGAPLGVPLAAPVEVAPGLPVTYYRVAGADGGFDWVSRAMVGGLWRLSGAARVILAQGLYNLATPLAVLIGRLRGRPVVVSPRGALAEVIIGLRRTRLKRLWLRWLMRPLAGRVLWHVTSEQEAQEVRCHFPGARVVVVPNGLDLDDYRELPVDAAARLREQLGLAASAGPVVVALGRLHPKKGLDVLIRAFERLRGAFHDARLVVAGPDEGGELARLRGIVDELGLERQVYFRGHLEGEEKRLLLAGADLFALPSRNENFGLVYAEALAAGTPVVASRDTPWAAVEEIGCGRWVSGSVEATAAAMAELLDDDPAVAGARGRRWVFETFDYRQTARRFDASVLGR